MHLRALGTAVPVTVLRQDAFRDLLAGQPGLSRIGVRRLRAAFEGRLERLGPEWIPVLWDSGRVAGFVMTCRTGRGAADFRSWEEMTDGGTLESAHDPRGRNMYIVTLSMLPSVSAGPGRGMLIASQLAAIVRHDIAEAYFESRVPGLRAWVSRQCAREGRRIDDLTGPELRAHAETYFRLTRTVDGRELPHDPLLTVYHHAGARFVRLIENGYQDGPSLNFGVLCVLPNPLPAWVQRRRLLRSLAGRALGVASRSPVLMRGAFTGRR